MNLDMPVTRKQVEKRQPAARAKEKAGQMNVRPYLNPESGDR